LIAIAAADPSPAAVITCARVARVPGGPDAGDARTAGGIDADEARLVDRTADCGDQGLVARPKRRPAEDCGSWNRATVREPDGAQAIALDRELCHEAVDDRDLAGGERRALVRSEVVRVHEEGHVVRPLAEKVRVLDGPGPDAEHSDRLVANLPAVAVRAVEEVAAPALPRACELRKLVDGARREQNPAGREAASARECERETPLDADDAVLDELDPVAAHLRPPRREQIGRRHAVATEEAVHVRGRCVARGAGVDDGDASARPAEHERRAEAGRTAADHHDVVGRCLHGLDLARERAGRASAVDLFGTGCRASRIGACRRSPTSSASA
jgi:hypothetical protein